MTVKLVSITLFRAALLWTSLVIVLLPRETQAQSNLPVCPLIATGGTIAMKIDPVKQAPVPAISGEDLLATVPDVSKYARVEVKNVSNVPSDYMDPPRWIALTKEVAENLERPEVAGVVISHGTDTLEETAWWLDLTVNSDKPVILIGAQRNASEKDFDGPRNLLNAMRMCIDPEDHPNLPEGQTVPRWRTQAGAPCKQACAACTMSGGTGRFLRFSRSK
jgi:Asparaginase, N-terminal